MVGRTETRIRDRIYCQTMRTVRDISRDDRARIAICSLRTMTVRQTDRRKENYRIDNVAEYRIMFGTAYYFARQVDDTVQTTVATLPMATTRPAPPATCLLLAGSE